MNDDTEVEDDGEATKREGPGTARAAKPPVQRLERGATVGRYIVLHVVGAGGMGVVYSAYDPELDRKVAVKLLQAAPGSGTSGGGQAWLLREAQAMARISHPNVIAVHDVGVLPGDRVFVAMELVDGATLRAWSRTEERSWRDVVSVMLPAGQGLAAAHAGGLVHRDFKPDNILVARDGRVRVMDFGLARLSGGDDEPITRPSDSLIETKSPLSDSLTVAGTVVGTPAYMAPELYNGEGADARSDQFSFGVALYEALFHLRPFGKESRGRDPKPPPPKTAVPARVTRVVMRAISVAREARYPSMDDLLRELAVAAAPRRYAWIAVGATACATALILGGVALTSSETPAPAVEPPQMCKGTERRLAGVWDAGTKKAVQRAFVASKKPFADSAYVGLERALDAYAADWTTMATDSCEATRIRGEQTEDVLSLRQACLDQRLSELRALTQLLAAADGALVEKADKVAFGLEAVKRCANVQLLRAVGAAPTEPRAKIEELLAHLAASKAALLIGRPFAVIESARKAAELAVEVRWEPYRAEALLMRGAAQAGIGNFQDAKQTFSEGAWAALTGNSYDLLAALAISLTASLIQDKVNEAEVWIGLARVAVGKVGRETDLELRLLQVEGLYKAARGDMKGALAIQEKALAASERLHGPNSPMVWNDIEVIAITYAKVGAWEKARPVFERSLKLRETSVGPNHPDIAVILTNLGAAYSHAGESERARAAYERALAIREKSDGPNNPMLILTLNNMADGMTKVGDPGNALKYVERARALAERLVGKPNALYHAVATTRAEALAASGRVADARKAYDEVVALETEFSSPYLGSTLASRGKLELAEKRWADAAALNVRAIAAMEALGGNEAPDLWIPLYGLARAKIGQGKTSEAKPLLERAVAIGDKAGIGPIDLDPVRALLKQLG